MYNALQLFLLHPSMENQESKIVFFGVTIVFQKHVSSRFCQLQGCHGQGKISENEIFPRSGKSLGILWMVREI